MPNKTPQKIFIERYDSLPAELKKSLFSATTSELIERVVEFYHLNEEKSAILVSLVGDVLAGFLHYNDFSKKIQENLGVNPMIANSIGKEIDRDIFLPVRKFLREVYRSIPKEEVMISETEEKKEAAEEIPTFVPEVKPAVVPTAPSEAAPTEAPERRSFLPFFRFKKTGEASPSPASPPVIIGHEEEIKPTLGTPTPFVISFEEVKPQKEKVVSSIEVAKETPAISTQPKIEVKKTEPVVVAVAPQAKPVPSPVKIVNYTAFPVEPATTKESTPVVAAPAPTKTPAAPIPEQKKEEPPVFKIPPIQPQQPPIAPQPKPFDATQAKPFDATQGQPAPLAEKPQEKPAPTPEKSVGPAPAKMPEVPPENVVDLRKFKF